MDGQQQVSGYEGKQLVNTFLNGDASTGTITSPAFTVSSHYIDLLVGGGNHPWRSFNPRMAGSLFTAAAASGR